MVGCCVAYNCSTKAGQAYSFHKFPNDKKTLRAWCHLIRRKNFVPTKHSRLCSKHFAEDAIEVRFGQRTIKKNALPTIFEFPKHIGPSPQKERTTQVAKRAEFPDESPGSSSGIIHPSVFSEGSCNLDNSNTLEIAETDTFPEKPEIVTLPGKPEIVTLPEKPSRKRKVYVGDFCEADMSSPNEAKRLYACATSKIEQQRKLIKSLRTANSRLKIKISSFKTLIDILSKKNLLSKEAASIMKNSIGVKIQNPSENEAQLSDLQLQTPVCYSLQKEDLTILEHMHSNGQKTSNGTPSVQSRSSPSFIGSEVVSEDSNTTKNKKFKCKSKNMNSIDTNIQSPSKNEDQLSDLQLQISVCYSLKEDDFNVLEHVHSNGQKISRGAPSVQSSCFPSTTGSEVVSEDSSTTKNEKLKHESKNSIDTNIQSPSEDQFSDLQLQIPVCYILQKEDLNILEHMHSNGQQTSSWTPNVRSSFPPSATGSEVVIEDSSSIKNKKLKYKSRNEAEDKNHRKSHELREKEITEIKEKVCKKKGKQKVGGDLDSSSDTNKLKEFLGMDTTTENKIKNEYQVF